MNILWIKDLGKNDLPEVGGKGANLGELVKAGIPVPDAFVVTASAYKNFMRVNRLDMAIKKILTSFNPEDSATLNTKAIEIQKLILSARFSLDLVDDITDAYNQLVENSTSKLVAVRSSATAEDLPSASFAGQQATFLNISGAENVVKAVQRGFASLFEARAIYYRTINNFDHFKVLIAVPVQRMIQSQKAGILFTINPLNNREDQMVIEAGLGLGESVVSGSITPDQYIVEKNSLRVIEKNIGKQAWQIKYNNSTSKNEHIKLTETEQNSQKITEEEILQLARTGKRIEEYYQFPQDTEWAIEPSTSSGQGSKIYFVQSRPITTIKKAKQLAIETDKTAQISADSQPLVGEIGQKILVGIPASMGTVSGPVKIIHSPDENNLIKDNDILVTEMTSPSFVPSMKRAAGIVTDSGGMTSHAAIVSRELGKPAIVGAGTATTTLKDGQIITIDGAKGIVYEGEIHPTVVKDSHIGIQSNQSNRINQIVSSKEFVPVTGTKVYVNLAEPESAKNIAQLPVDGVGLLRAEFMIAEIGEHPQAMIKAGRGKEFSEKLTQGIFDIASAFAPRPVIYRATDFKTNEYKGLKGGEEFEGHEENPMIGVRGALRYILNSEVFKLELEAIKTVRTKFGLKNLYLMIPFVRTVDELSKIHEILRINQLERSRDFKLWIMVEVPSTVFLIDRFCEAGIDGVSIGSNDLTQLILGADRDNAVLSKNYDERDPAVLMAMARVINVCRQYHKTVSICGNSVSVYPEIVEFLVSRGITSVSVTPDVAIATRKLIASVEKKILLEHKLNE
ncbi:MAG: pyruvate, water dikinase [Candidatus Berkelbacteria bacterium Licking1014_85]|uniref:Phosphoenolpyruvate synthase n=1 Tax=Candidatus Berkelbacteria bacterium Licking1014_85 TaxID=2017148 RepID=A0A554LLC5_9BACT|nr:MAG: pyruvate, water dikinase [Candidatus Berkelbacteria bacterium Licking1014_85]